MTFQRRRRNHHLRLRYAVPIISALSGLLLLFFALIFLFSPLPVETDRLRHYRHDSAINAGADDSIAASEFSVLNKGGKSDLYLWRSRNPWLFEGCSNASKKYLKAEAVTHPNRYLMIVTSGGLNQQRTGITDAVVVARMMNATLVIPKLDKNSFWKDSSNFSEIFDSDWFVSYLSNDVKIIKNLPGQLKNGKDLKPYTMRVPRKCNERCYQIRLLRVLLKRHAVQLTKFDYRLSNRLDTEYQKLRCRVNYHALKFTEPIIDMGQKLVQRMRMRSKHFIALHLRFEPDMLAFSGCYYGGGEKEREELRSIRRRWKTLHKNNPDKERRHGRCPLTPEEVGLMLRALGYGSEVHIYVASGEVYGGEETLAPLKALFPNYYSKETIATKEELEPFSSFSSRMAALDFMVCDESDVFVTNNNGNMAKVIAGRRRYYGHKRTIRPNAKKLYKLFLGRNNMTWEEFATQVRTSQIGFMGEPNEVRPGRGIFHENPAACICDNSNAKAEKDSGSRKFGKGVITPKRDTVIYENGIDETDWSDNDNEDENDHVDNQEIGLINGTVLDFDPLDSDDPEFEEILSD